MQPVQFEGANTIMGLEGCFSLHVKREIQNVEGLGPVPVIESVWELSTEDIINILTSQKIKLTVIGEAQPPVRIEVVT